MTILPSILDSKLLKVRSIFIFFIISHHSEHVLHKVYIKIFLVYRMKILNAPEQRIL